MLMIKSKIKVKNIEYEKDKVELISAQINTRCGESQKIIVAYVPPKTKTWNKEEHKEIIEDTLESLEKIIKNRQRVTLVGDFNCSEVNWETFEVGGENTWGNRLLRLTMNNTMTQWITENTTFRGEDKPSRLDLLFTKGINPETDINYECLFGRDDPVVLEIEIKGDIKDKQEESYKKKRRNHTKANCTAMKRFFNEIDWTKIKELKDVQEKYDLFLMIYEQGIKEYVTFYKVKEKGKKRMV